MQPRPVARALPRLLFADDDPGSGRALCRALESAGYAVLRATDAAAAAAVIRDGAFDLAIVDADLMGPAGMPGGNDGGVPIIAIVRNEAAAVGQAFDRGAAACVTRPVNAPLLIHRVGEVLHTRDLAGRVRASEERLSDAQRLARLGHWEWEAATAAARFSDEARGIFGLPKHPRTIGYRDFLSLVDRRDRWRVADTIGRAMRSRQGYRLEHRILRPDGGERVIYQRCELAIAADGRVERVSGIAQDVTERCRTEQKIRYLAYFDSVTGLPNRTLLRQIFDQTLANATRYRRSFALLFVDLDHFKRVNDLFGHEAGDLVLCATSNRLRECLRTADRVSRTHVENGLLNSGALGGDAVSRLGGDEFVVLLSEIHHPDHASVVAWRMVERLSQPVDVGNAGAVVSACIGIAVYPNDGADFDTLLRNADTAMYHAKRSGRGGVQYFSESLNEHARRRFCLERDLRQALQRDEFVLHYQPRVDLATNHVAGIEALLRWRNPDMGLLIPADFLDIAEEIGLIAAIDDWVLTTVTAQTATWHRMGYDGLRVAINVSPAQFRNDRLPESLAAARRKAGLGPGFLQVEVPESLLFDDLETAAPMLEALDRVGATVAIDNFGSGRSSLWALGGLTVHALKIDRMLVRGIDSVTCDAAVVQAIASLARGLGLRVVAEGVERRTQLEAVRNHGCHEAQGYLFSRPLPIRDMNLWLAQHAAAAPPAKAAVGR